MSFQQSVQETIVNTFILCLKLVRDTSAICESPFAGVDKIKAPIEFADLIDKEGDYADCMVHSSHTKHEPFLPDDIPIVSELWSRLVKLRQLDKWSTDVFSEPFFAQLDRIACEKRQSRDTLMRKCLTPELLSEFWDEESQSFYYRKSFQEAFHEREEEIFSNRTRIGRALTLFDQGLNLPALHAFLSMCIVLETLFNIGRNEITHQLATRFAKLISKDDRARRAEFYKQVKSIYNGRSEIVHGNKLLEAVDPNIWSEGFNLARLALRTILLDDRLLALYSDPSTSDDKKKGKGKGKGKRNTETDGATSLEEFFLHLDLDIQ